MVGCPYHFAAHFCFVPSSYGSSSTIEDGACQGANSCRESSIPVIKAGTCNSPGACFGSTIATLEEGSCTGGTEACAQIGASDIAENVCVGDRACFQGFQNGETVGLSLIDDANNTAASGSSCLGPSACEVAASSIGPNSCDGPYSCAFSDAELIFDDSCNGYFACTCSGQTTASCFGSNAKIGSNSCNSWAAVSSHLVDFFHHDDTKFLTPYVQIFMILSQCFNANYTRYVGQNSCVSQSAGSACSKDSEGCDDGSGPDNSGDGPCWGTCAVNVAIDSCVGTYSCAETQCTKASPRPGSSIGFSTRSGSKEEIGNSCVGEFSCDLTTATIGGRACRGEFACFSSKASLVSDASCVGQEACVDVAGGVPIGLSSTGKSSPHGGSCRGSYACLGATTKIGATSCTEDNACFYSEAEEIADSSCTGMFSCELAGNDGVGTIGFSSTDVEDGKSCIGDEACAVSNVDKIGASSCQGVGACLFASNYGDSGTSEIADQSCVVSLKSGQSWIFDDHF